jgi:diguanylate cyclase (GGDEF)-like protein
MPDTKLAAQLDALQKAFAATVPDKIARLDELLTQCAHSFAASQTLPGDTLRDAHLLTHSLAGSSGTFGFNALGEAAHTLEEVLAPLLKNGTAPDEKIFGQIRLRLAAIRAASQTPATPPPGLPTAPPVKNGTTRHTRSIYLVEDDAELAASLAVQLSHFGYHVRVFACPTDVIADAEHALPVAIIMDIGFPEGALAGPQAVKNALRDQFHGVPVFFISARGDFTARLEAVRAGGVAYFTKPIDIGSLINALEAFASQALPTAYRVLIVDDSESTAAFYQHVLTAAGMEAMMIHDPSQITEPLAEFAPDLILMDIYMPICNGVELAALIRQQPSFVSVPIVFLSTETNVNRQLVALRQGGDDFLSKPIDPVRLVSVVTSRAARGRILRAHMVTDGLTGLLNHSHLEEQLETEIVRSHRQGKPLVFAMIDIDHFKRVNDTWGHAAGDRVLRSLSKLLRQRLRRTDVAGRYGGEEFGVILTDLDAHAALPLLDAIRRDFAALSHASGDSQFNVSFSAGIAGFPHHRRADTLIAAADAALYIAKNAGRDRIVLDGDQ